MTTRMPGPVMLATAATTLATLLCAAYVALTLAGGTVTTLAIVFAVAATLLAALTIGLARRMEAARIGTFVVGILAAIGGLAQIGKGGIVMLAWGVLVAIAVQIRTSRAWFDA